MSTDISPTTAHPHLTQHNTTFPLSLSIEQLVEYIERIPLDRESIPQEKLDLANKIRTSVFPWRGQFSPELVEVFLEKYAREACTILDPFVGIGTTLFEAAAKGLTAYGADINPSAIEMARTAHFATVPYSERKAALATVERLAKTYTSPYIWDLFSDYDHTQHPSEDFDASIKAAMPSMLHNVEGEPFIYNILINVFIRYMNLRPPRTAADFLSTLKEHADIIESISLNKAPCKIMHADARSIPLPDKSIDLIITSPPYINVFNYHQNNRPAMELLGWDLLSIAKSEIGSNRKNRQNRFLTVIQYAIDMFGVLCEMKRLLRPDGRVIIVIGKESTIRGLRFKNGTIVAAIAVGAAGFQIDMRQERKFKNKFGEIIYEDILHLTPHSTNISSHDRLVRDVASWSLLEASKTGGEQVRLEVLEANARVETVQKSPLFTLAAPSL